MPCLMIVNAVMEKEDVRLNGGRPGQHSHASVLGKRGVRMVFTPDSLEEVRLIGQF